MEIEYVGELFHVFCEDGALRMFFFLLLNSCRKTLIYSCHEWAFFRQLEDTRTLLPTVLSRKRITSLLKFFIQLLIRFKNVYIFSGFYYRIVNLTSITPILGVLTISIQLSPSNRVLYTMIFVQLNKKFPQFLFWTKGHFHVHKISQPDTILRSINPVHTAFI
jgi:hypothetical protein